jgi:hypothetical protein
MLGKTPAWLHQQTGRKDRRRDVERHPHRCERDKPTADHPTHLVADVKCQRPTMSAYGAAGGVSDG